MMTGFRIWNEPWRQVDRVLKEMHLNVTRVAILFNPATQLLLPFVMSRSATKLPKSLRLKS